MKMKIKDLCFFYHSVKEKSIVGIVEVVKEHYFASPSVIADEVDETPIEEEAEKKAAVDPMMDQYASAISRSIKK